MKIVSDKINLTGERILAIAGNAPEKLFSGDLNVAKSEYHALSRFWHPDHNKNSEAAAVFQRVSVGDVRYDSAPLQATQFEADIRITAQLEEIYIEHGGGGNSWESYNLPWYFAAQKTSIDCLEKRGKKGYLFTVGDEQVPEDLTRADVKEALNMDLQMERITNRDLLTMVGRSYEVFHLMVEEGSHYQSCGDRVKRGWTELLGQRAIPLADHTKLAEVIVSTIEVCEGRDKRAVADSWDRATALVVARAVGNLEANLARHNDGGAGVVRF